jgi:hypothetical protein
MGAQRPVNIPPRKRRSPLLMGCLILLGLIGVVALAGGIYVWRSASYTPPERKAPAVPERTAGTMTEFPVDGDTQPTNVQTEMLGGTIAKSSSSSNTKLPPGIDRTKLAKGATAMTSSTYKPKTTSSSSSGEVYVNVLSASPGQSTFGDSLASSVVQATGGQKTGVRVQTPTGAIYTGTKIRSPESSVYVLTKQGGDIVILIYSPDSRSQALGDRLAQSVGNGQGLLDYPQVKESLWTLPASTPSGLTLVEMNSFTGAEIENSIASAGGGEDLQRTLSQMKPFIPNRLVGARYTDASRGEWVTLTFEYDSTFQAWRTWLLARSALGLGGAETTTVREVTGVSLNEEGMRLLVFQKGPYLIFLRAPGGTSLDRLVLLGDQFQV